jgi:Adenylate and Guanylate cyclase catalytic domain
VHGNTASRDYRSIYDTQTVRVAVSLMSALEFACANACMDVAGWRLLAATRDCCCWLPWSSWKTVPSHAVSSCFCCVVLLSGDPVEEAQTDLWAEWYRNFLPPDEAPKEPIINIVYPIIDDLSRVELLTEPIKQSTNNANYSNGRVVGVIAAEIYWRELIRKLLPKRSKGIDVVFDNACTQSFTYRVNGPNVVYRGLGDQHEVKFDHRVQRRRVTDLGEYTNQTATYSGVPVDTDHCPTTLSLYPSQAMEDANTTSNRIIFPILTVLIFAFTSLVFVLYDRTVERRQRTVLSAAVQSSNIVSSLFPSEVRERLYNQHNQVGDGTASLDATTAKGRLTNFLRETHDPVARAETESLISTGSFAGPPIAELYPETTVLFADIAGFTAWSSERHPSQVFHLLESVYAAFDAIARRRGVFKVETIGDSYVAVVGLPAPRKHHAVVMARFANDCRDKMCRLTEELAKTLGPVRAII